MAHIRIHKLYQLKPHTPWFDRLTNLSRAHTPYPAFPSYCLLFTNH